MNGIKESIDPRKGRTLIADRDFPKNELVFQEVPFVSCQFPHNQDLGYAACDHCMAPLETAQQNLRRLTQLPDFELLPNPPDNVVTPWNHVQCPRCRAKYCGVECQQTAFGYYHKSLCAEEGTPEANAIQKLRAKWQEIHWPPEESTIMLVLRIFAIIHQAEDKNAVLTCLQNFTLVGSEQADMRWIDQQDAKRGLYESLIECVHILQLGVPAELLTMEAFGKVLSILALNSQGIATSSFADWVALHDDGGQSSLDNAFESFIDATYGRLDETVGTEFLNNEGSGLYPIQSKMSHSCDPNTEIIFPKSNHVLALRALRDIHKGEELTFSYIEACDLSSSRHTRQKLIKAKYLFDCVCHKCESELDQPDETSESESESS